MQIGDIIYHNELIFSDGKKDQKHNRPCIFLFEEEVEDEKFAVNMPLSSNIETFNKKQDTFLIPDVIYRYRKLSFAKIGNIVISPMEEISPTGRSVSNRTVMQLLEKIMKYEPLENQKMFYEYVKKSLETKKELENIKIKIY